MEQFLKVADAKELPPGEMKAFDLDGQLVLIANVGGEYCAFSAVCPHLEGPLDKGRLEGEVVECPWHHYRFNVRSGENWYPKNVYPKDLGSRLPDLLIRKVRVEGDEIWVGRDKGGFGDTAIP